MSDTTYNTYSSKKPNALTTGINYGVNEMLESGSMMGLQSGRKIAIDGFTGDMEDSIMKEMLNDGLQSAMSNWTGAIMQKQEQVLEGAFKRGAGIVVGMWGASKAKSFFKNKFRKGRKASMLSKFLGDNDSTSDKSRLVADFVKMDLDTTANSHNPSNDISKIQQKQQFEAHEVNKESTRTQMANLQLDGLTRSFEWKLKTSSFTRLDKPLIKKVTGLGVVTDEYIDKLNSQSLAQSFQDSSGNWVGGNQVTSEVLNALNLSRV